MFKLTNKTAVITGGGSGIGKAISLLFAKQGAYVHIFDFAVDAAKQVVEEIELAGGKASAHFCDVANQEQVVDLVNTLESIDILVNNAGISNIGRADNTSEEDFDRVYQVNVKGAYNLLHACIPIMKKQEGAS